MALLKIETLRDSHTGGNRVVVNERLFLTADRTELVRPGDRRAAFLFCSPGKRVLVSELDALGASVDRDGKKRDKGTAEDKESGAANNKGAGIDGNVKIAKRTIAGVEDLDELAQLEELEAAREGGPRVGVTKALEQRRADLES